MCMYQLQVGKTAKLNHSGCHIFSPRSSLHWETKSHTSSVLLIVRKIRCSMIYLELCPGPREAQCQGTVCATFLGHATLFLVAKITFNVPRGMQGIVPACSKNVEVRKS